MKFFCNYIWDKGLRDTNEDSLCIRQVEKDGVNYFLAVVCDGIGGLEEGENASGFVANSILESFKKIVKKSDVVSERRICSTVKRQIYKCHKTLQRYGKEQGIRLGTTLSMLLVAGRRGYLFHVGDSAVYGGKRKMRRLTPFQRNQAGALLQAVGVGRSPVPFCRKIRIKKGMVLLLASDGFYRKSEHTICAKNWIKRVEYDEKKIGSLLLYIKDNVQALGEKDNISAICIKVR